MEDRSGPRDPQSGTGELPAGEQATRQVWGAAPQPPQPSSPTAPPAWGAQPPPQTWSPQPPAWGVAPQPPQPPAWGVAPQPPPPAWGAAPQPPQPPAWGGQPNQWGQPGPAWQPGSGQFAPVRSGIRARVLVGLGLALLVVAGAISVVAVASLRTSPPAPHVAAGEVFHDNFIDHDSGWYTGLSTSGTVYTYSPTGYQITLASTSLVDAFALSPYKKPLEGLSITATESISDGAADTSGIGILCRRGTGDSRVQYEFQLKRSGKWVVFLRTGAVSMNNAPVTLRSGTAPTSAGATPVSLAATCRTSPDRMTTQLTFAVDGTTVVDFSDAGSLLPDSGWVAGA